MPYIAPRVWGDPSYMFSASQQLVSLAESYINQLTAIAAGIVPPNINVNFPTPSTPPTPGRVSTPPLETVTWTVPTQPSPFTGQVDLSGIIIPPFTGIAPTLDFGTAPPPFTGTAPAAPTVNLDFVYPTVSVTLPEPPELLTLDTVNFPTIMIPPFNVTVPTFTAVEPEPFNYTPGTLYTSKLLTDLEEDLDTAITTGGEYMPLNQQAQQAIWDAGRDREYKQQAAALAELNRMKALGYATPPNGFANAKIKIQTETNYTIAGLSREITAKQAELRLMNVVKARENATVLEHRLIQYANETAQRAFEAAKYATEAGIAIYNAKVQAYAAALEGYKAQVLVYETQIKGIMAQVQVLQAQIEYEKAKADINTSIVKQYETEVQAQLAVLQIYKTQVEIIQTQAQVEKLKVDIYSAEIQAFVGKINAYTAEVEAYKAGIEAQATIEQAYKTSVDAYSAEVNASVAQINAKVAVFHSQVEAYQAQLSGYDSAIKGMVGQAQAAAAFNTATADVFKAQVQEMTSYNQVLTAQWEAIINAQTQIAQIAVSAAKANGDLYIASRGLSLDASKVGAQVCAQLGAAALGAISWHNSSQWSSNMQSSDGNNVGVSTSFNTNTTIASTVGHTNSNNQNTNVSNNQTTSQNYSENYSQNYSQGYNQSYNDGYNTTYNQGYNENNSQNDSQNSSQISNQTDNQSTNQTTNQSTNQTTNQISSQTSNQVSSDSTNNSTINSQITSTSQNDNTNINSSS